VAPARRTADTSDLLGDSVDVDHAIEEQLEDVYKLELSWMRMAGRADARGRVRVRAADLLDGARGVERADHRREDMAGTRSRSSFAAPSASARLATPVVISAVGVCQLVGHQPRAGCRPNYERRRLRRAAVPARPAAEPRDRAALRRRRVPRHATCPQSLARRARARPCRAALLAAALGAVPRPRPARRRLRARGQRRARPAAGRALRGARLRPADAAGRRARVGDRRRRAARRRRRGRVERALHARAPGTLELGGRRPVSLRRALRRRLHGARRADHASRPHRSSRSRGARPAHRSARSLVAFRPRGGASRAAHPARIAVPALAAHALRIAAPARSSHPVRAAAPSRAAHPARIASPVRATNAVRSASPGRAASAPTTGAVLRGFVAAAASPSRRAGGPPRCTSRPQRRFAHSGRGPVDHRFHARPAISADGRIVAYDLPAPGLVADDRNSARDVFLRDAVAGRTQLVSVARGGTTGNATSRAAAISADGRVVAFESSATDLATADDPVDAVRDGVRGVFVRDLRAGTTRRVAAGRSPALSGDGRIVAYERAGGVDVADLRSATTRRIAAAYRPALSADGRFVAFETRRALVRRCQSRLGRLPARARDRCDGPTERRTRWAQPPRHEPRGRPERRRVRGGVSVRRAARARRPHRPARRARPRRRHPAHAARERQPLRAADERLQPLPVDQRRRASRRVRLARDGSRRRRAARTRPGLPARPRRTPHAPGERHARRSRIVAHELQPSGRGAHERRGVRVVRLRPRPRDTNRRVDIYRRAVSSGRTQRISRR
jgi:hypothetical protein